MKRKLALLLTLGLTTSFLVGCGNKTEENAEVVKLEVAFNQPDDHPQFVAMQEFADTIKEKTNGAYEIEIFPNELLGAQKETLEMTQGGSLAMTIVAGSLLESWNPDFSVFNLPYVFETVEHQQAVLNNDDIVGEIYDSLSDQGLKVIAGFHGGVRNVYTNVEGALERPADLDGIKIRVMQSDTNVKMMELMGGTGTPMGQGDVYTGIQTGVLGGGENNELIYSSLKHTEVAPYYTYTKHLMMPDYLVINNDIFEEMPEDVKKIFEEELQKAVDSEFAMFQEAVDTNKAKAKEEGATFYEIDIKPFQDAVRPLTEEKLTNDVTKKLYEDIISTSY